MDNAAGTIEGVDATIRGSSTSRDGVSASSMVGLLPGPPRVGSMNSRGSGVTGLVTGGAGLKNGSGAGSIVRSGNGVLLAGRWNSAGGSMGAVAGGEGVAPASFSFSLLARASASSSRLMVRGARGCAALDRPAGRVPFVLRVERNGTLESLLPGWHRSVRSGAER